MRKFAPFAASFLSALVALPALAADLRPVKDPAKVVAVFSSEAKLRVMNVWATWCGPCVAEMRDLRAIDDVFGPEVAMVGVSFDDVLPNAKQEKVAAFLDNQKIAYPNVYFTGNVDEFGKRFKLTGEIPVTIVYDRGGKELLRYQGVVDRSKMILQLRDLLRRTRP